MISPLNHGYRPGKSPFCTLGVPVGVVVVIVTVDIEVIVTVLADPVHVAEGVGGGKRQEHALDTRR